MSPQLYLFVANTREFVKKHHAILFICLLGILLAFSVFSLYQAQMIAFEKETDTINTAQTFDEKTVEKIKNLHNSSDSSANTLNFPSPRANPFSE